MLRSLAVLWCLAAGIRYSLKSPFYALLFYLWLAYFRPERWLWWDFVSPLKLSLIVGAWTLLFTFLSDERPRFDRWALLLFVLVGQGLISTLLSPVLDVSIHYLWEFARVIVICYLMLALITTEQRFRAALLVIALSLGLEAVKQGWVQLILNPGAKNDNESVLLGDNNGVALGMLMLFSHVMALIGTASTRIERYLARFAAVGIIYRALSTYSRGGFLAGGVLALQYVARSKHKVIGALAVIMVSATLFSALPDSFWERMSTMRPETVASDQIDESAAGRLHFWDVAMVMANARPLTGFGFNAYNWVYDTYDFSNGLFGRSRSVHSSWFGMLAEIGYPGFLLFLILLGHAFLVCLRVQRLARTHQQLKGLARYASGIEGALVAFVIGGTFLPFQYNEFLWHTLALALALEHIVLKQLEGGPQNAAI